MNMFTSFLISFLFNLAVAVIIVRWIYYPATHNKRFVFSFLAFNTIIFFVLNFMASIEIGIGVGFGLFAIFSILRYRTDPMPVREMTYLFIIAALPVMNTAATNADLWPQLLLANTVMIIILLVLEKGWGFRYENAKRVVYEKISLIRPEYQAEMISDLESRTGLHIKRVEIGKVDFLRDVADLRIFYDDTKQENWLQESDPYPVSLDDNGANGTEV